MTKAEMKIGAWQKLERELATAEDILMVPSLFKQISEIHHMMSIVIQNTDRKEDYNIQLTITP